MWTTMQTTSNTPIIAHCNLADGKYGVPRVVFPVLYCGVIIYVTPSRSKIRYYIINIYCMLLTLGGAIDK